MISAVLDTHVWIWFITGSRRLGPKAKRTLSSPKKTFGISALSLWEAQLQVIRGRIEITSSPDDWIDEAVSYFPLEEIAVTGKIARHAAGVNSGLGDPIDSIIASGAHLLGVPLLTADEKLLKMPWLNCIDARK